MDTLQKSLLGNAVFSLLSGILLILFHGTVAHLFGVESSQVFWVIGVLLMLFAMSVFAEVRKQRLTHIFAIIVQDGLWVAGSAALLLIQPFNLSSTGNLLIGTVAIVVLFFALVQSKGVMLVDSDSAVARKKLIFDLAVPATKRDVWALISEVSDYHNVAPNIDKVEILSGEGEGMVRRYTHGDEQWTETCTAWQDEELFSFEVDTKTPEYPYPFSYLKGTWKVEAASSGSRITMVFDIEYRHKIYALLLHPFLKNKFDRVCGELLKNWERRLEKRKIGAT